MLLNLFSALFVKRLCNLSVIILSGSNFISSKSGKDLYPNMAYYTAILCELIEWPAGFEFLLVCMFRAGEWRKILDA